MEINKEEFKIWITALRSGEYQQSMGTLEDNFGYCCLGVACRVLIPEDKLLYREGTLGSKIIAGGDPIYQSNAPQWLKDINDDFKEKHGKYLFTLNDKDKLTFNQIADLLEKYYLSMTTQQLLIPRWRVLGDWPGKEPNKFNIGDIITDNQSPKELPRDQNGNICWRFEWAKYPRLFKRLGWWEERTPEDLECVKYIKDIVDERVYEVGSFKTLIVIQGFVLPNETSEWDSFIELESFHIPITKEDYDQATNKIPS